MKYSGDNTNLTAFRAQLSHIKICLNTPTMGMRVEPCHIVRDRCSLLTTEDKGGDYNVVDSIEAFTITTVDGEPAPPPSPAALTHEGTKILLGITLKGIYLVVSTTTPNTPPTIFMWDLFKIKSWSYSRNSFCWLELGTRREIYVRCKNGYELSCLIMDYALKVCENRGKGSPKPPCFDEQHNVLSDLIKNMFNNSTGNIVESTIKRVNSLKAKREDQKKGDLLVYEEKAKRILNKQMEMNENWIPEPFSPYRQRSTSTSITIAFEPVSVEAKDIVRYETMYGIQYTPGWDTGPTISHKESIENAVRLKTKSTSSPLMPTVRLTGLKPKTNYVFIVRAMNGKGFWSEWSDTSEPMCTNAVGDDNEPDHLFMLSHGFAQNENNMTYVKSELEKRLQNGHVVCASRSNGHIGNTRDGIDSAGRRLAVETIETLKRYPEITKISFLGHNVGGLFIRYAISELKKNDIFVHVKPVNLIFLGTPHVGNGGTLLNNISEELASALMGDTGLQLNFEDSNRGREDSLLYRMSLPPFTGALLCFPFRVNYANILYDGRVAITNGTIVHRNEFEGVSKDLLRARGKAANPRFPDIIDGVRQLGGDDPNASVLEEEMDTDSKKEEDQLTGTDKLRNSIVDNLRDVGFVNKNVIGYSHDGLIEDGWKILDLGNRNQVIDQICETILEDRKDCDANGWDVDDIREEKTHTTTGLRFY